MDFLFRCRINNVDHYQTRTEFDPPLPRPRDDSDKPTEPHKISVIRVFGATPTGQKVLMHIHGVLQYTYIEYSGSLRTEDVESATQTLQVSIDYALATSYRQDPHNPKNRYVAHITLVKGVPFYGYHVGYKHYLKIYLLNPMHMTRLADLLREGAVMKRVLQPMESHMQYIAQWMCDYNLYGCAYLDCTRAKFRSPVPDHLETDRTSHTWHDRSIPYDMISDAAVLPKQSHCTLEVDILAEDITNRHDVQPRDLHHDFVERLRPLPVDKKLVASMAGLWKDETRRRKARMGLRDPHSTPFPPEVLISMSANSRNIDEGGWIHEQEFREKIERLARQEHENSDKSAIDFDNFVEPPSGENEVKTALQSVEDLYHDSMVALLDKEALRKQTNAQSTQAVVDENVIRAATELVPDENNESGLETSNSKLKSSKTMVDTSGSGSNGSESDTAGPISSGEFADLGVRRNGDFAGIEEDKFLSPEDYHLSRMPKRSSMKRAASPNLEVSVKKRQRFAEMPAFVPSSGPIQSAQLDNKLGQPRWRHDEDKSNMETTKQDPSQQLGSPRNSQRTLKPLKSTLNFPVVKNPNDPNTIKRLSQQSNSPEKTQKPQLLKSLAKQAGPLLESTKSSTSQGRAQISFDSVKVLSPIKGLVGSKGDDHHEDQIVFVLTTRPPRFAQVAGTVGKYGLPEILYQDAYYSQEEDVPERNREYAGKDFKLVSATVPYLPDFDPSGKSLAIQGQNPASMLDHAVEEAEDEERQRECTYRTWVIAKPPPPRKIVIQHFFSNSLAASAPRQKPKKASPRRTLSQIQPPTQANKHGFKYSSRQESTSVQHETQYMSVMSLEVHVNTRGSLAPNPEEDEIACIFWCIQSDDKEMVVNTQYLGMQAGILVLAEHNSISRQVAQIATIDVDEEQSELELLVKMVDIVRFWDPDILTGYEVHNSSWGYLIERARVKYDLNFCDDISRMKSQSHGRFGKDEDRWGFNHTSTIRVTGRHTINIWRAMRGELNLLQYTLENVAFHLLHIRVPHYSFADLTRWYKSRNTRDVSKVIDYFSSRVQIDLRILEANELIPRTSEQARLIGIDWFSVISRGSQFKVENIMFRIAKPENFLLVSPSRRQVGGQNALECLPLVMEPQSDFYTSPMLVFDFQSLYPSVMIAYNYCYSTFLGRVVDWRGNNKMGFMTYQRQNRLIELLKDHINVAPNGIIYARPHIRRSLLAKMLSEILETRVMVKSGMKADKEDKTLQRLLNNRQLALKLIANVTYGYTSASFSGRMPCSEIADSIVQTGRETLEKAIALIHSVSRWGAEVVYGDTDSLFVHLKGRSREQAFKIGDEIAKVITDMNPQPVKLKFEKIYQPCILLAKKRYVGFKYESPTQQKPEFEAKGIETVRRDGTPAEQKIEENALKVLFRTSDLSKVKAFFQAQCAKIMQGKVSIQDFCFAKEVKLGTYSDKGPPPPGALISARRMLEDPRLEPQYGERIPYVVVTGGPRARLIDRCVAPDVLLNDAQQQLDAEYYISKNIIPPLERIFNLVGANVRQWYDEMPKFQRIRQIESTTGQVEIHEDGIVKRSTLESYMPISHCIVCKEAIESEVPICESCFTQPAHSLQVLRQKLMKSGKRQHDLNTICRSCSGFAFNEEVKCDSKDCPVFYSRTRQGTSLASVTGQFIPIMSELEESVQDDHEW